MDKTNKKEKNIYKITTYILVVILVIASLLFASNYYANKTFNEGVMAGQQSTMNVLLSEVNSKGYIEIRKGENTTLVLVPSQVIQQSQENLILEIIKNVDENGHVSLFHNEEELILIPYVPEQAAQVAQ